MYSSITGETVFWDPIKNPGTLKDFSFAAAPWLYNMSQIKLLWDPEAAPQYSEDIQITLSQAYSMENIFISNSCFPKSIFNKQHF